MIGYVTIGSNDLDKAGAFYDQVLGPLGAERAVTAERMIAFSAGQDKPGICVCKPFDGNAATVGNGTMVAMVASGPDQVREIYDKAIELGGSDEGPPGLRGEGPFYGAYFRDLDGNKLCAFCMVSE